MMEFDTPARWLEAIRQGEEAHIVPKKLALELLSVSRSALDRKIEGGEMNMVVIGESAYLSLADVKGALGDRQEKVGRLTQRIVRAARDLEVVYYGDIMPLVGLSSSRPPDRGEIGSLLAEVSRQSYNLHGIVLSALVHRKPPKGRRASTAGPGFFNLVEDMGIFDPDEESEMEALSKFMDSVYEFYAVDTH